jgi:hypothetical protein
MRDPAHMVEEAPRPHHLTRWCCGAAAAARWSDDDLGGSSVTLRNLDPRKEEAWMPLYLTVAASGPLLQIASTEARWSSSGTRAPRWCAAAVLERDVQGCRGPRLLPAPPGGEVGGGRAAGGQPARPRSSSELPRTLRGDRDPDSRGGTSAFAQPDGSVGSTRLGEGAGSTRCSDAQCSRCRA